MSAIEDSIERARRLSDSGEYATALSELDAALELDAANADALEAKAWVLENLGPERLPEARITYASVQALRPENLWARAGLANVLRRLGDTDEALRMFQEIEVAAKARMSHEPDLLELVGWSQYRLDRYESAMQSFEAALATDEDWVSVRFDLALTQLSAGLHGRATASYEDSIARARARRDRIGLMHVALDDLREAMADRPQLASSPGVARISHALARELESPSRTIDLEDNTPSASPG